MRRHLHRRNRPVPASFAMVSEKGSGDGAIFEAAIEVALARGFGNMTLAEVAIHAGLSKGGLLYHFDSKKVLLAAMLDHFRREAGVGSNEARKNFAITVMVAAAQHPELLSTFIGGEGAEERDLPGRNRSTSAVAERLDIEGFLAAR